MTALVLVTRPAGVDDSLQRLLEAAGYRVTAVPTIATEPVPWGGPLDDAAGRLDEYDWVVVTSATGVRALAEARERVFGGLLRTNETTRRTRWAAVGRATARALEAAGVRADVLPDEARSDAIPAAIAAAGPVGGTLRGSRALRGSRILLARADAADGDLPRALEREGAVVDDVVAYRTVEAPVASVQPLAAALDDADLLAIVVASGSAARGLLRLAERTGRVEIVGRLRLVSIGPSTSRAIRSLGLDVAAEADTPTPESLAAAVAAAVPLEVAR